MDELISETIEFIRKHEPPEGYFVGFSGGKDSIVTLDLVRRSAVKHQAYFNVTTIDPPEIMRFIRENYSDVIWIKPELTYWQWLEKNGIPSRWSRWCCDKLKHGVKGNRLKPGYRTFLAGIRAEESFARKKRGQISLNPNNKVTTYKPIFEWSSPEVWEYIKNNNLTYPTMYDEGFARVGCIICPFISKTNIQMHRDRWPGMYRVLDINLNRQWEKKSIALMAKGFTYEEFMSWPNWKTKAEREYFQKQLKIDYEGVRSL